MSKIRRHCRPLDFNPHISASSSSSIFPAINTLFHKPISSIQILSISLFLVQISAPKMATDPNPDPIPASNSDADQIAKPKPSVLLQDNEELRKVFDRFDANGDGKISITELDSVLKSLGSSIPCEELSSVMEDLDSDKDGYINIDEFAAFCKEPMASDDAGASELRDAFDLYDQDHNGLISHSELHLVLNRLGISCSKEDCQRMIHSVDSDGDGNVNFEEFRKMMTANSNSKAQTQNGTVAAAP